MRDLARSLHLTGRPVPVPWPALGGLVRPRGQNLMLVLAAGGVGKSAFALEWAVSIGAPVLYVSLDTSLVDHGIRLISRSTGMRVDDVQRGHDVDPEAWAEKWGAQIRAFDYPVRFCDLTGSAREIRELVAAEAEYWGEAPLLTVVDNLGNLLEGEEGASEYRRILAELHRIAKEHDTLVMALHHTRRQPPKKRTGRDEDEEEDDEGTKPVHLSDALYEGDKEAQYVLGLWRPEPNKLSVGVLKNRMGTASRSGKIRTTLRADLSRFAISQPGDVERYVGVNDREE